MTVPTTAKLARTIRRVATKPPRLPPVLLKMTSSHPLGHGEPAMARELAGALVSHIVPGTAINYNSAAGNYEHFCSLRGHVPYPCDHVSVSAWIMRLMTSVKPTSLNVYLAAVRNAHINHGHAWSLTGNESIRRVRRYVKRRFPSGGKGLKIPISMAILKRMLPLLPGWPNLAAMSYEDLLFACASVIGVCGFLRGGEFLFKPGQARRVLRHSDMALRTLKERVAVVVGVPQAKATWWLSHVFVPCFQADADVLSAMFCPVRLWRALCSRSPFLRAGAKASQEALPAFHQLDGAPLRRDTMVARTLALLKEAGISLVDGLGRPTSVMSSSWRAGGVRSAVDAGLSEALIMDLGRWKSSAWASYLLHTSADLCAASSRMWHAASPHPSASSVRVVREVSPGPQSVIDDAATASKMRKLRPIVFSQFFS
jgi:hypothetical protein